MVNGQNSINDAVIRRPQSTFGAEISKKISGFKGKKYQFYKHAISYYIAYACNMNKNKVREKSRECHNHKPQPPSPSPARPRHQEEEEIDKSK